MHLAGLDRQFRGKRHRQKGPQDLQSDQLVALLPGVSTSTVEAYSLPSFVDFQMVGVHSLPTLN